MENGASIACSVLIFLPLGYDTKKKPPLLSHKEKRGLYVG